MLNVADCCDILKTTSEITYDDEQTVLFLYCEPTKALLVIGIACLTHGSVFLKNF